VTDDLQDRTSADAPADDVAKPTVDTAAKPAGSPRRRTAAAPAQATDPEPEATGDDPAETDATPAAPATAKPARPAPVVRAPSPANLRRQAKKEMARRAAEARRRAKRRKQAFTYAGTAAVVVILLVGAFLFLNRGDKKPGADASASPAASVSLDPALKVAPTVSGDPALAAAAALADTKVTTLVTGTGPVVKANQFITVNYTGVTLADGKQFDSSWTGGKPVSFQIGAGKVIEGWDKGLVGVTVGSRVQLDIPQSQAYPNASGGQPAGALRFVVDILAVSDTEPAN